MADPCSITNVLANAFVSAVTGLSRKLAALQRFAQLLEQQGNIGNLFGGLNLSSLVPLSAIDLNTYASLLAACPALNLPAIPSTASVASLQAMVGAAYTGLVAQLNSHPFMRMGQLQAQMDKLVSEASPTLSSGNQFLACLFSACSGSAGQLAQNYPVPSSQVLTPEQQTKVALVQGMIATLNQLNSTAAPTLPATAPLEFSVAIPYGHPIPVPPRYPIQP